MTCSSVLRFAAWAILAAFLAGRSSGPAYGFSEGVGSDKGKAEKTSGTVVSTKELSVDLKADGSQHTFYAAKRDEALIETIAQLAPQDNVTITWRQKGGKKMIDKIEGRGTLQGTVTARTQYWIEVKPDKGAPQRFTPAWVGGSPAEGGGLDKNTLKKMSRAKPGDTVLVAWEISEGKCATDVKVLAKGSGTSATVKAPRTTPPHHPYRHSPNPNPIHAARAHWIWHYRHLP
jgi:hypothetical protein